MSIFFVVHHLSTIKKDSREETVRLKLLQINELLPKMFVLYLACFGQMNNINFFRSQICRTALVFVGYY
jgi:hypothetical protein